MARLEPLTPEPAIGRHDSVRLMVSTMAHSPAMLDGYLQLNRAMQRATLPPQIIERISLAVQQHQGCDLRLTSHTDAARSLGIEESEIYAARQGGSDDPRIAVMVAYGLRVHMAPDTVTDQQIVELRQHGYTDREIAEVVGIVALNVLTGAFSLVAGLPVAEIVGP